MIETNKLVDFAKQLQVFAALDLLYSDIASLNYATSGYHRITCAMNVLDKLANMIKYVGGVTGKESEIFKSLLLIQQCDICCRIYEKCLRPINEELSETLVGITKKSYEGMHDHYRKSNKELREDEIVDRLYNQRNLRHGTFLKGEQFMRVFQQSEGTVANEIVVIVYLLTLALALDPRKFLRRDP